MSARVATMKYGEILEHLKKVVEDAGRMLPEEKTRWVVAILSNKYDQNRGGLRSLVNPRGRCCLGVLCDVVSPEQWKFEEHPQYQKSWWKMEGQFAFCPQSVLEKTGLPSATQPVFIQLNDRFRLSFHQLSDVIEEYL